MSRKSTINPEGRWYKGNTHAHTNLSDGTWTPEVLVGQYRQLGYDFTALTDHRIYGIHSDLSRDGFLVLPGVELDIAAPAGEGFCHHLVGLGLPGQNRWQHGERITYPDGTTVVQLAALLRDQGNICLYAHPAWSHVRHEALDGVDGFAAMEIYNHTCEVGAACGSAESWYDRLLWQGRRVWCLASDDTHQHRKDYGGGFIRVKAASLTQQAILDALLAGSFHASEGPAIEDFSIEDGQIRLACSPCRSIGFLTDSHPGFAQVAETGSLTEWHCPLRGSESYIRAVCTDQAGRRAWSQPIWLDGSAD